MNLWPWVVLGLLLSVNVSAQQFQHAGQIGGTGYQSVFGIATDPTGNIYATGVHNGTTDFDPGPGTVSISSNGAQDGFVTKWSSTGQHVWTFTLGGVGPDGGQAIAYNDGFIYVGGRFRDSVDFDPEPGATVVTASARDDMYVAKYDTTGQLMWVRTFGGPHDEELADLSIAPNGNVTFCGLFSGPMDFDPGTGTDIKSSTGTQDAFVCQLDPNGQYVFSGTFGSAPGEFANGVDHDPQGNLYVTGQFWGTVDFDPGTGMSSHSASGFNADLFMFSWDGGGSFRWSQTVGSSGGNEIGYAIVEQNGVVTAGGGFQGTTDFDPGAGVHALSSAGDYDHFIWQLDTAGQFVNAVRTGGPNNDAVWGLDANAGGSVFATGYFSTTSDFDPGAGVQSLTSNGGGDVFILELDAGLSLASVYQIGGIGSDYGQTLHLNGLGEALVGGQFRYTADFDPGPNTSNLSSVLSTTDGFITAALYCTLSVDTVSVSICPGDSAMVAGNYFNQPGTYQEILTGVDGCDSIVTIEVDFFFTISTSADTSICPGDMAMLEVFTSQGNIQWSTGDTSATIAVGSGGMYTVTVTYMGCTVYDSVMVTMWPDPVLDIGPDVSVCPGDSVLLGSAGTFATCQWSTGSMQPEILVDTGTYWLAVTDSNGCAASDTITVDHYSQLNYTWPDDTAVCHGGQLVIHGPAGFAEYVWPDSSMDSVYAATTIAQVDSQYTVLVQLTDSNGCETRDSIQIQIHVPHDLQLPESVWACPGDTVILMAASGFSQYAWSTGSTGPVLMLDTDRFHSDTVPIILSALDSNGCLGMDTVVVLIHQPVRLDIGQDTTVCKGASVEFSIPRSFSGYLWSTGDTSASTLIITDTLLRNPFVLYAAALDSNGCSVADSVQIGIVESIPFSLGRDTSVCKGELVQFSGPRGYSDYRWSNGVRSKDVLILTDTVSVPRVIYSLSASDSNGCTSSDTIQLSIHVPARFELNIDTTVCEGEYVEIRAPNGFSLYQWSNGDTGQVLQLMTDTLSIGEHWFGVTASDSNGCIVMDSVKVTVEECPGIGKPSVGKVTVYPNPVDQMLFIELESGGGFEVVLRDSRGKNLGCWQSDQPKLHIDMSHFPEGTYLLQIHGASMFRTYKFVKIRAR